MLPEEAQVVGLVQNLSLGSFGKNNINILEGGGGRVRKSHIREIKQKQESTQSQKDGKHNMHEKHTFHARLHATEPLLGDRPVSHFDLR